MMSGVMCACVWMAGCGGEIDSGDDEVCEEALSPDEKVRCRDTTMVKTTRAYRMPDDTLHLLLEGEVKRENPDFYIELTFNEMAQQQAPQTWNWMGNEGISTTFYDRERDPQARNDFYAFPPENGIITVSEYGERKLKGVLRNFRYEDRTQLRGVALIPTMRFDLSCIGDPVNDDPSCAGKCGVCVANDRCGNEVIVSLPACSP